jgi:penicillin-binding protein 1C
MDAIPEHASHCPVYEERSRLEIVYPVNGIKIFIPRDLDGEYESIVFSVKHQRPSSHIFWYLNGNLIGNTTINHQLAFMLDAGQYKLTVLDEEGFSRSVSFTAYKSESS